MKRLKIVEQIIIVLVIAVLLPFATIGVIISNISQHSIRSELANSAILMSEALGNAVQNYVVFSQNELNQIAASFKYIEDSALRIKYFDEIEKRTQTFKGLDIVENKENPENINNGRLTLYAPIDSNLYLKGQIDIDISDILLGSENTKERNIYIFSSKTHDLIVSNAPKSTAQEVLSDLVVEDNTKKTIFGDKKNTPKAYYKIKNPDWFVVVDTTKKVTKDTITKARYRIILSLFLAAVSIFTMVGFYTFYLYVNIRQLFKGITAISKGNYDKKIHLIKRVFTPNEIVFLSKEFNYMANKIKVSHKDLKEKNKELQKLNEFRENLINSTSHEFRTPLTSIIGYTSRLLRHDIELDEQTKTKSLQIIKQQAQRLSRMVEDLLVIPEIDSSSLKYNIEEIDLSETILRVLDYLKSDKIDFKVDISSELGFVWADEYRLEQVFLNLVDNAMKYSLDDAPVEVIAKKEEGMPVVYIKNKCDKISDEIKEKLFEKFIRADSALTRTTRGTGLGLYIVKGLADDMNIEIDFSADDEFVMKLKFKDFVS